MFSIVAMMVLICLESLAMRSMETLSSFTFSMLTPSCVPAWLVIRPTSSAAIEVSFALAEMSVIVVEISVTALACSVAPCASVWALADT